MSAKEVESVEAILEQHLPEGDLDAVKGILYGKPLKYRKTKTKTKSITTNNRFPLLIFLLRFLSLKFTVFQTNQEYKIENK
jgi:hypothetical protein